MNGYTSQTNTETLSDTGQSTIKLNLEVAKAIGLTKANSRRIRRVAWKDSVIFGGKHWPIIQKLGLRIPSGEVVSFRIARKESSKLYVTVYTGVCDLYFAPANPTVENADMRIVKGVEPFIVELPPGAYTLYVRAGDSRLLQANLVCIGAHNG